MENSFSTQDLKVGDKVFVLHSNWGSRSTYLGEIVKKTPTGMVDVAYGNGVVGRFRKNGSSYSKGSVYDRTTVWLEHRTEEKIEKYKQEKKRKVIINFLKKCDWSKYTNEELESIFTFITNLKNS